MRLRKKILSILVVIVGLFAGAQIFGIPMATPAYAQSQGAGVTTQTTVNTPTNGTDTSNSKSSLESNMRELADLFLKIVYVILWPLIFLSGLAMDNTLVYGEVFHMDSALRTFWNYAKNFANFALGFMILREIIKSIFTIGGASKPLKTIQNAIVAGILIQISWFVMAALIDISTITTYAVGGMPMSILKTENNMTNTKILQPNVYLNLNSTEKYGAKDFQVTYQTKTQDGKTIYLSPCRVQEGDAKQKYIVGRTYGDEKFKNQGNLGTDINKNINACVLNGHDVRFFNEFPDIIQLTGENYSNKITEIINFNDWKGRENCGYVVKIGGKVNEGKCNKSDFTISAASGENYLRYKEAGTDKIVPKQDAGSNRFLNSAATQIGDLVKKSNGYVGPLATIYSSLLDFANLSDVSSANNSAGKTLGELTIRSIMAGGLIFPLIALTLVLIVRIGFLWLVIIGSPIIALSIAFGKSFSLPKDLAKHADPMNIIKVVFAPVITVFAMSIGLVFMTALISTFNPKDLSGQTNLAEALASIHVDMSKGGDNDKYDSISIMGTTIKYDKSLNNYAGATGDWFSWMIICFSGMGIMWFVLFAAIKQGGTIGEDIGKKVQDFSEKMLSTTPILSIPGVEGKVGIGTLGKEVTGTGLQRNMEEMWNNSEFINLGKQQTAIDEAISKARGEPEAKVNEISTLITDGKYEDAFIKMTGKKENEVKLDDIISSLDTHPEIETQLNNILKNNKDAFNDSKYEGLDIELNKRQEFKTAKEIFEKGLTDKMTESELNRLINSDTGTNLAKASKNYTKDITIGDGDTKKEFKITSDGSKLVATPNEKK